MHGAAFIDDNVIHVANKVDPKSILNNRVELILADLRHLGNRKSHEC